MPKVDAAKLKNQAQKFLQKGKLDKALETYRELEKAAKNDLRVPQKIAEILAKMGDKKAAIEKYKETADKYLEKGFLVQAIAINKVILELDPAQTEAKAKLEELMAQRTGKPVFSPREAAGIREATPTSEPAPRPGAPEPPPPEEQEEEPEQEAAEMPEEERHEEESEAVPLPDEGEEEALPEEEPSTALPDESDELALPDEGEEIPEEPLDSETKEYDLAQQEDLSAAPMDDEELTPPREESKQVSDDELALLDDEPDAPAEKTVPPIETERELPAKGPEHTPLFSDLKRGEFDRVFELLRSSLHQPGDKIISEGDKGDSIFIIARGEVEVTQRDAEGREITLAELGPGDFFGEFGYFSGAVRHATVKAKTPVHLLELTKEDADNVIKEFPRVGEVMLEFYKERVVDALLATSPLFRKLSPKERKAFMAGCRLVEFNAGDIVVKEGDPGHSMYVIKSGEVEVTTINPLTNEPMVLARLKPGEFFGEVSLIKGKPRTATITAKSKVELLEFHRQAYEEIAPLHPEITEALEELIEKRVENTIHMVTSSLKPDKLV